MFENEAYKGRTLDLSKRVEVYRNINHKCLSVVQNGLVVARVQAVKLKDVTFHIKPSKYKEFLRSGHKNVHATAKGYIAAEGFESDELETIEYNPHIAPYFRCSGERVDKVKALEILATGSMQALI